MQSLFEQLLDPLVLLVVLVLDSLLDLLDLLSLLVLLHYSPLQPHVHRHSLPPPPHHLLRLQLILALQGLLARDHRQVRRFLHQGLAIGGDYRQVLLHFVYFLPVLEPKELSAVGRSIRGLRPVQVLVLYQVN